MLKIAICDDDKYISSMIENYIFEYSKLCEVKFDIEVFYKGEKLIEFLESGNQFDLIFLDIELDTMTGIEVGNTIRKKLDDHITKIVFITSKDGYEYQLFDIQPLNFIKKPIDTNKLQEVLRLAIKLLEIDNKTFEYNKNFEIIKVEYKEILYFEKVGKKVKIVTLDNEDYFNDSLENTRKRVSSTFVKSHGSFLININKVRRLNKDFVTMVNGATVPVSQKKFKELKKMIIDLERDNNSGL